MRPGLGTRWSGSVVVGVCEGVHCWVLIGPSASQFGFTALLVAACKGGVEATCLLLDRGADIEAKEKVRPPVAANETRLPDLWLHDGGRDWGTWRPALALHCVVARAGDGRGGGLTSGPGRGVVWLSRLTKE